ncbi:MAG TPA: PilZ domain-containing protein, partial [Candidatus Acidoferrales bacterium]|nr:PilZ domain-containing protein [Candidatus Acidoferrales bacterium]
MSQHRRSDRIDVAMPIQVIGMELSTGQTFCKETETRVISRHGASIVLNAALPIDDEITIRCLATNEEAKCRVVGLIKNPGAELIYGIAFLEPNVNPWGIDFPELRGPDNGLARVLLSCASCQTQEVVYLNEIEMQIFETNRALERFCRRCSRITSWKFDSMNPSATIQPAEQSAPKPADPPAQQTINRRKHGRIRTSTLGCVRSGVEEEMVTCEDVSRGGVSFRTLKIYQKHGLVHIAVPCSKGAGNIFVP